MLGKYVKAYQHIKPTQNNQLKPPAMFENNHSCLPYKNVAKPIVTILS